MRRRERMRVRDLAPFDDFIFELGRVDGQLPQLVDDSKDRNGSIVEVAGESTDGVWLQDVIPSTSVVLQWSISKRLPPIPAVCTMRLSTRRYRCIPTGVLLRERHGINGNQLGCSPRTRIRSRDRLVEPSHWQDVL